MRSREVMSAGLIAAIYDIVHVVWTRLFFVAAGEACYLQCGKWCFNEKNHPPPHLPNRNQGENKWFIPELHYVAGSVWLSRHTRTPITPTVAVIFRYSRVQSFCSRSLGRLRLVAQQTSRHWMCPWGESHVTVCACVDKRERVREIAEPCEGMSVLISRENWNERQTWTPAFRSVCSSLFFGPSSEGGWGFLSKPYLQ